MGFLHARAQNQLLVVASAIYLFAAPTAFAANCVRDSLKASFEKDLATYHAIDSALEAGHVPVEYFFPKGVQKHGELLRSAEIGLITGHDFPEGKWLSGWIKKIHDRGGELRFLQFENKTDRLADWKEADVFGAYFDYDYEESVPYIAISAKATPDTLAHEYDHLEKWINLRDRFLNQGYSSGEASRLAQKVFRRAGYTRKVEQAAVSIELQVDSAIQRRVNPTHLEKWKYPSGALPFTQLESLTRQLTYPEAEALRIALKREKSNAPLFMRALIRKTLLLRLTAYQRAKAAQGTLSANAEYMKELENFDHLFDSVFLNEKSRFELDRTYQKARKLFESLLPEVWQSLPVQKRGDFKPSFH